MGPSPVSRRCPLEQVIVAALLVVGCTMPNPEFDARRETVAGESGDGDGDPGDGDPGDGDPGDGDPGDGDGDPGDGDGDPGCAPPLRECFGECVDTDIDLGNCGSCGVQCVGDCVAGSCIAVAERIVFLSSGLQSGMMGGLEGADDICNELAAGAGLDGEYMAWLSSDDIGPADRMVHYPVPYRLPSGALVANSWTDLTDGTLAHPIDSDESGQAVEAAVVCEGNEVWTNTKANGTPSSNMDCGGWTSGAGTSTVGRSSAVDGSWTVFNCPAVSCETPLPIYCIQQ
ncbi:MAG TPA: hypothetical protein VM869_04555 [Enhygromyxa sp.]|nr:hypothetical protein [Enhygromyxa sp.]